MWRVRVYAMGDEIHGKATKTFRFGWKAGVRVMETAGGMGRSKWWQLTAASKFMRTIPRWHVTASPMSHPYFQTQSPPSSSSTPCNTSASAGCPCPHPCPFAMVAPRKPTLANIPSSYGMKKKKKKQTHRFSTPLTISRSPPPPTLTYDVHINTLPRTLIFTFASKLVSSLQTLAVPFASTITRPRLRLHPRSGTKKQNSTPYPALPPLHPTSPGMTHLRKRWRPYLRPDPIGRLCSTPSNPTRPHFDHALNPKHSLVVTKHCSVDQLLSSCPPRVYSSTTLLSFPAHSLCEDHSAVPAAVTWCTLSDLSPLAELSPMPVLCPSLLSSPCASPKLLAAQTLPTYSNKYPRQTSYFLSSFTHLIRLKHTTQS